MRLLPSDLPLNWHLKVAQRRANPALVSPGDPPPPRLGFWGRMWCRGSGLSEERAAAVAPVSGIGPALVTWLLGGMAAFFGFAIAMEGFRAAGPLAALVWLGFASAGFAGSAQLARSAFHAAVMRPLGPQEVQALGAFAPTDLDRELLGLVGDLLRLNVPPREEAPLRAALADLAVAVGALPVVDLPEADPHQLRLEASEVEAAAADETDRPTAESHARRAQALRRQADSAERAGILLRRTQAVREEVRAHIASLRTGLAAFHADTGDAVGLAALAESARTVAQEATNVANARVELAQAVSSWPATAPEEPAVLRATQGP